MDLLADLDRDLQLRHAMSYAPGGWGLTDLTDSLLNRGREIAATLAALRVEWDALFDGDLSFPSPQGSVDEAGFDVIMADYLFVAGYFYDLHLKKRDEEAQWSNLIWYGSTPEFSEMFFPDTQGSATEK